MTEVPSGTMVDAARRKILMLHRLMMLIMIGYIPAILLAYLMQLPEWVILLCAMILVLGGIGLAFRIGYCRCPVCNERYHVRGMTGNILAGRCMHCGVGLKFR